jgi:hypothetical protein
MEFALSSLTSHASVSEFPSNMEAAVSDVVAGLHRINARRAAERAAVSRANAIGAPAGRYDSSIPTLSAGFGYLAWRG